NVVDEIESLIRDYDIKSIEFEDDNLTFDIKRANDIFDEVLKRKLKFKWRAPNGIRADLLDSETIKKFKDAGCYELWFAPESGSQRVVNEVIGKRLSLSRVDAAIKECLMNGITVNCFLVIGLPGETKKEIEETLSYMKKLRKMGVGCYINIATPLYGTKLHRIATEKKYLRPIKDSNMLYNNGLYLDTPDFSAEEVYNYFKIGRKIQKKIVFNKEFVLFLFTNHRRIVHHIVKKIAKMSSRPNG
nr:radical SAM protein [Candidatus Desulfatibia profunda]